MFQRMTEETFDEVYPLLQSAFPVTELREKERQRALLREPFYRLYGVAGQTGMQAVFAVWEIEDFLYIEHFAVREDCRNTGWGGRLLDRLIAEKDRPVVLEVEVPEDALTRRRVAFYERHGFVYNSYPYLQPPMRKGQGMLPLMLMTHPSAIDERTYERYKALIHKIVYHYEEGRA